MDERARRGDDIMESGKGGVEDHEANNQSTCAFAIRTRAERGPEAG